MIELSQLEYLRAFVKYGTLTKAAEELHMSQPALTRSMQKLEDELGVPLFTRQKNKLTLNENGKLASECARTVLESADNMVSRVRAFDLSQRTINISACAPVPLQEVQYTMSRLYAGRRIASKMEGDTAYMEQELEDGTLDMIVLPYKPENPDFVSVSLLQEQLYFLLPKKHPLAVASGLYMKDMDGQPVLLFSEIGFWQGLVDRLMPHTTFIKQTDRDAFQQIVDSSDLPSFYSSQYTGEDMYPQGKVPIPILDPEAKVTYYAVCKKGKEARKLQQFLDRY